MDADETLQRLWTGGKTGRRGPKPALNLDRIVDAAIGIADAEGLAAVSMARVGESLGCSSMALYRHVSGKAQLLTLMIDRVAGMMELPDRSGAWREDLTAWTRAQIDAIVERPWFLDLPLTSAEPGPQRMRWIEAGFEILADFVLPGDDKLAVLGLLAQYVLSVSRTEIEYARSAKPTDDAPSDFEQILTELADPERFPHTVEAMRARRPKPVGAEPVDAGTGDEDLGLRLILDGISALAGRPR